MTDRVFALTVTLDNVTRIDDAQAIIDAIGMVKGVATVVPLVASAELYYAQSAARRELLDKIFAILVDKGATSG